MRGAPIRVGLIRCDTHGMWFGPQMEDHDPRLLERATEDPELQQYETWLRRGVHYFFYTHYSAPERMTAPRVEGFRIVKLWDERRAAAEVAAKVFHGRPVVCESFDQVSDDVDLVFIADCNGDGRDHLELARPGLRKGVPTFVDKPLAHCLEDALAMVRLAAAHTTPLLSLSILQTNPATARIARRLEEVGRVSFGTVTSFSMHPAALIHAISIVHHVFGTGIRTVRSVSAPQHTALHLDYGSRDDRPVHGVVINCGVAKFRFTEMFVSAFGPEGAIQGLALNDWNASEGSALILEHVKEMVQSREVSPLGDQMLEAVAVMDAAREAVSSGEPASVMSRSEFDVPGPGDPP